MIRPRLLRLLDLVPGDGAPYLSAASGLVRAGRFRYVLADDELHLGVFDADSPAPGERLRLFPGELPAPHAARKAAKPDLEILLRLPPGDGLPHGALLALGSGSRPQRDRGALLPLAQDGAPAAAPRVFDAAPWYDRLRAEWPALNLEGGLVDAATLMLFQRASRAAPVNLRLQVPLAPLLDALLGRGSFAAVERAQATPLALGAAAGIGYGITDAALLPDGRTVFCAAAEDSLDSYADGPCDAAALGLLDRAGRLLALEPLDTPDKVEGIEVELHRGEARLLLATDADDATRPARLLQARLPRA